MNAITEPMTTNHMLDLAVSQGEALIDRAMVARVTRARLVAQTQQCCLYALLAKV